MPDETATKRTRHARIVSFSGIDGAGKSTHIAALCRFLENYGSQVAVLTFWDDVVAFAGLREHLSLNLFKGDRGIGSPEKPITRRDKNVSSWYLTALRIVLYLLDALRLLIIAAAARRSPHDFVVFDRYIYDELANLPLQRPFVRFYVRFLLKVVPKPDVAFLVDADPDTAVQRKPEYPLEFVRRNREAYLALGRLIPEIMLVPALQLEPALAVVQRTVSEELLVPERPQNDFPLPLRVASHFVKTSNH